MVGRQTDSQTCEQAGRQAKRQVEQLHSYLVKATETTAADTVKALEQRKPCLLVIPKAPEIIIVIRSTKSMTFCKAIFFRNISVNFKGFLQNNN